MINLISRIVKLFTILVLVTLSSISNAKSSESFSKSMLCLTSNIYHEARGEPLKGRQLVAFVTLHRTKAKGYPKSVCGVVKHSGMSWVKEKGKHFGDRNDKTGWIVSKRAALEVVNGNVDDFTNGALFFNHKSLGKRFKTKVKPIIVGNLIGY